MKITLISPAAVDICSGNLVTAQRWANMLSALGHDVRTRRVYEGEWCDLLIALHAGKCATSIERFAAIHPNNPIIVAMTGTDIYGDLQADPQVLSSLELATRIVALQPSAIDELPQHLHERVRVIYQSVSHPSHQSNRRSDLFEICVIGNLREVKDPFRIADAVKHLPEKSRIQVVHIGAALSGDMASRAKLESETNDRYQWLGPLPREQTMQRLADARLMVLTSIMEGGANVVSEAIVCCVPVISSHISGSIGLLGEDYPGYFPVGDEHALAAIIHRAEADSDFLKTLTTRVLELAPLFDPANEQRAWEKLLVTL